MQETHDLCQINLDKSNDKLNGKWFPADSASKPGRTEDNYLKEERLYRVFHDKHYDGIGPTEQESGLPLALKTTVDKPKDWYKSMFKAMHKAGRSGYIGDTGTEDDTDDFATIDEALLHRTTKVRLHPGSISNWTPGSAYVSESKPSLSRLVPEPIDLDRGRRTSARGEAARDTIEEITSKPWKAYFDDVDSVATPMNLMEKNPRTIQGKNPSPVPPRSPVPSNVLTTQSVLEGMGPRPSSRSSASYVTAASKSIGPYLQTTVRRLIPETEIDTDVYAKESERELFGLPNNKRKTAKVLFTFKARSTRELTANKGEQVIVIREISDKWIECESNGRQGMLPIAYIELNNEGFKVIEYGTAVGRYDFKRKSNKQMSFKKDDPLTLIRIIDQNWYEARLTNREKGYVPRNYITVQKEPITNEDDQIGRDLLSPAPSVSSRPVSGTPLAVPVLPPLNSESINDDVFRQRVSNSAVEELNAAVDELSNLSVKVSEELDATINHAQSRQRDEERPAWVPADSERYEAIYSFKPQHEDELELEKGDLVYVFEKCSDGWFIGAHGASGSIGTFPGNYTTKV